MSNSHKSTTYENRVCNGCPSVCDDLTIAVENGRIVSVKPDCSMASDWFNVAQHEPEFEFRHRGSAVDQETALSQAATILRESRSPLICGLQQATTATHRAAIALADHLGAVIAPGTALDEAYRVAVQTVGESSCTLGEVRQRADVIVYWGCDPVTTHPRHFELLESDVTTPFLSNNGADRTIITVDETETATSAKSKAFFQVDRAGEIEAITALRAEIRQPGNGNHSGSGFDPSALTQLAGLLTSGTYGVIFYKPPSGEHARFAIESMLRMVAELNAYSRFSLIKMGPNSGAANVLAWQSGYPDAVDFSRGFPRSNPGEFSANSLLERHEVDACLMLGRGIANSFSKAAIEHLNSIPVITIDQIGTASASESRIDHIAVEFMTSVPGIHGDGTAIRHDGVALPLSAIVQSSCPSAEGVLKSIQAECPVNLPVVNS